MCDVSHLVINNVDMSVLNLPSYHDPALCSFCSRELMVLEEGMLHNLCAKRFHGCQVPTGCWEHRSGQKVPVLFSGEPIVYWKEYQVKQKS